MSIWWSGETIGWEPETGEITWTDGSNNKPTRFPARFERGEVRTYAEGWSNHYPSADVERPASVNVAAIAPWCVPGHAEDCCGGHDAPEVGPWLRLLIDADQRSGPSAEPGPMWAGVVMDAAAVEALRDDLNQWLAAPKVEPRNNESNGETT